MFLDKETFTGKKNKIIVGYDLGDQWSQISFCHFDGEEPRTLSVVAGEEQYDFPTVLCRRREVDQWICGKEAVKLAAEGRGMAVEHLLTLARDGSEVEVGEEKLDPVALLALFIKRSLSLLGMNALPQQIDLMMITVEELDRRTIEVLSQAVSLMQLSAEQISFQSYAESFYHYMLHQPRELWLGEAFVCDYENAGMKTYRLECNKRTTPVVAYVEDREYPQMQDDDGMLLNILEENCGERTVSSAYLIGRGFEGDWYQQSLRYLCRGRRVFKGNNLYSKGACFGARAKVIPDETEKQYVFLGKDKLQANVGMGALRRGEDSYYALLHAGTNWFEAQKQCEFYLESGNSFSIRVISLTGKESKEIEIILNDLPVRSERATRIRMLITMESGEDVSVTMEDLGFGEIYPATHKIWQEHFKI